MDEPGARTTNENGPPGGGQPGPPGPPGWGAPPPPGPPYGYAPAPSAPPPAYGGPTAIERPVTVRAGLGSFLGALALSVLSAVVTFLNWDSVVRAALTSAQARAGGNTATTAAFAEQVVRIGLVGGLLFTLVYGIFIWFAWRGRNWARIVLWALGGLGAVSGLFGLLLGGSPLPFLTGLSLFHFLMLVAAIVFLALKPSNDWYRYQSWLHASGRAR